MTCTLLAFLVAALLQTAPQTVERGTAYWWCEVRFVPAPAPPALFQLRTADTLRVDGRVIGDGKEFDRTVTVWQSRDGCFTVSP